MQPNYEILKKGSHHIYSLSAKSPVWQFCGFSTKTEMATVNSIFYIGVRFLVRELIISLILTSWKKIKKLPNLTKKYLTELYYFLVELNNNSIWG